MTAIQLLVCCHPKIPFLCSFKSSMLISKNLCLALPMCKLSSYTWLCVGTIRYLIIFTYCFPHVILGLSTRNLSGIFFLFQQTKLTHMTHTQSTYIQRYKGHKIFCMMWWHIGQFSLHELSCCFGTGNSPEGFSGLFPGRRRRGLTPDASALVLKNCCGVLKPSDWFNVEKITATWPIKKKKQAK